MTFEPLRYNFLSRCGCKLASLPEGLQIVYCDAHNSYHRDREVIEGLVEALSITRGQWIHSVNADKCLSALKLAGVDLPQDYRPGKG